MLNKEYVSSVYFIYIIGLYSRHPSYRHNPVNYKSTIKPEGLGNKFYFKWTLKNIIHSLLTRRSELTFGLNDFLLRLSCY